jgi:hypothetical protein
MTASTKKSSGGKAKAQRSARKQNRSQRTNTLTIVGVAVLAGFLILAVGIILNNSGQPPAQIEDVQTFKNLDRSHTTGTVDYEQIPPVGGSHASAWQNCGVYTEPVSTENAVHSLEHGAIWITYQPDLPAAELQKLQEITRKSDYRLLSPYPGIPSPIVASAWGFQIQLDSADDERLMDFINKYEQYPLGPEPGATCTGGVGDPG